MFPVLPWLALWCLITAVFVVEWLNAPADSRSGVAVLVASIVGLCAAITAVGWLAARSKRHNRTTVYENGIRHGSPFSRRWIPWSEIRCFYTDAETVGSQTFRFLNWQRRDSDSESFSVVPDSVDLDVAVQHFKANGVEEAEPPEDDHENEQAVNP